MYFELPYCRRCCLCVPLRHGILIFGYLNLIFSVYCIGVHLWYDLTTLVSHTVFAFRGVLMHTQLWFCFLLYTLEVIFNAVLLVGAHRKNTRLIRVYYYYEIVTTLASFLTYVIVVRTVPFGKIQPETRFDFVDLCIALSGLVLQCYLLLLLRSELSKLQYQGGTFRYVNQATEVVVDTIPAGLGREGRDVL